MSLEEDAWITPRLNLKVKHSVINMPSDKESEGKSTKSTYEMTKKFTKVPKIWSFLRDYKSIMTPI